MIKIRSSLFETNSSSVHTISIDKDFDVESIENPVEKVAEILKEYVDNYYSENYKIVFGGEYGWGYEELDSIKSILDYLFTYLYKSNKIYIPENEYDFESYDENFSESKDVFVIFMNKVKEELEYEYEGIKFVIEPGSYIDHQSVSNLNLFEYNNYENTEENLVKLLFGKSIICIDNDNH